MFKDASEALTFIEKENVALVDVRFCDLPGVMQHFTIPVAAFKDEALTDGLMFDGSSIRGFTAIHESDMKLVPDVTTAFLDPFREEKTLVVNFSIVDPFTDEVYARDPRSIAAKAEDYLRSTGIADTCYIGAEAEFYLFDSVRYESSPAESFYAIDSAEAAWNTGREEEGGNKGYKTAFKGGYFPVSPNDQMADIRDRMVRTCLASGLEIERAHHEVGIHVEGIFLPSFLHLQYDFHRAGIEGGCPSLVLYLQVNAEGFSCAWCLGEFTLLEYEAVPQFFPDSRHEVLFFPF